MKLPFTVEQFFSVFEAYNQAIWPAQIVAYVLGLAAVFLAFRETAWADMFIAVVLALSWVWMGTVYHLFHFAPINPAARLFGAFFIIQGILFVVAGPLRNRLGFEWSLSTESVTAALFILYSMLLYPLLGYVLGHHYPRAPMFGVAPCPTTIFTFGMLLLARPKVPWYLFPIPLLWSLVGMSAALNLQVVQDYGLVVAGVLGTTMIVARNRGA